MIFNFIIVGIVSETIFSNIKKTDYLCGEIFTKKLFF